MTSQRDRHIGCSATSEGRTFVIADPSLQDERGHHFRLAHNISEALLAQGFRVVWFAHLGFAVDNVLAGVEVRPVFSATMYDKYKQKHRPTGNGVAASIKAHVGTWIRQQNWVRQLARLKPVLLRRGILPEKTETRRRKFEILSDELKSAMGDIGLTATDHLLFHTADGLVYRALLELASTCRLDELPNIHVATPYDTIIIPNRPDDYAIERIIYYLSVTGVIDKKIFLYGENELLARYLADLWSQKVRPLDLPPETGDLIERKSVEDSPVEVVYLGAARIEKGFLKIPPVVDALWESCGKTGRLHFTIQCSPQIVGYAPGVEDAIDRLSAYPESYVRLVRKTQTDDEYSLMLDGADVVMLCYDRNNYRVRGSGIAVEAVSSGKIVLGTPGTFPVFLSGEAAATGTSAKELAVALEAVVGNIDECRRTAIRVAKRYRKDNSAAQYVHRMLRNVIAHKEAYNGGSNFAKSADSDTPGIPSEKAKGGVENTAVSIRAYLKSAGSSDRPVARLVRSNIYDTDFGLSEINVKDGLRESIRFGSRLDVLVNQSQRARHLEPRDS